MDNMGEAFRLEQTVKLLTLLLSDQVAISRVSKSFLDALRLERENMIRRFMNADAIKQVRDTINTIDRGRRDGL